MFAITLLAKEFTHFLDEFVLGTIGVAAMFCGDVTVAVNHHNKGNHLSAQSFQELAVGVQFWSTRGFTLLMFCPWSMLTA